MIRRRHAAIALAVLAMPVAACSMNWSDKQDKEEAGIAGSGSGDHRTYKVEGFTTVALAAAGDVDVRVGPAYSVTATGAPEALDKLKVTRDGDTLKLARQRGVTWGNSGKVHFTVTMPRIQGADIGGSGTITVDRVEGERFEGNIGGSGTLDIRGLNVRKVAFAIGGSGDVAAAGRAGELEVSIGGSGKVRAQPLRSESADITIAGSGNIATTVTRQAEVTILGAGDVVITGGAQCKVTKMGAGNVRCG